MLFKSQLLTQASGSIGGITASRNRGGMYFRARAIPTDPSTIFQTALRAIFTALVERWNADLTQIQRDAWDLYASLVPLTGPLGDPITVSGQNHYVRANTPRLQALEAVIDDGPTQFDLGNQGVVTLANPDQAADDFEVEFDDTAEWAVAPGGFLFSYISRPQNPSINYFRGPWRFVASIAGGVVPPTSPDTQLSPFPLASGQRLWLRTRASTPDGRLSAFSISGPIVVT